MNINETSLEFFVDGYDSIPDISGFTDYVGQKIEAHFTWARRWIEYDVVIHEGLVCLKTKKNNLTAVETLNYQSFPVLVKRA